MAITAADKRNSSQTAGANPPDRQSIPQARVCENTSTALSPYISPVSSFSCSDVRPWITLDVAKFTECSMDDMLNAFLVDCTDDPGSSDKHFIFKNYLEAVLPLCNGTFHAKGQPIAVGANVRTFVECETSKRRMEGPLETYTCQPPKYKHLGAEDLDHEPGPAQSDMLLAAPTSSGADSRPPPCEPQLEPRSSQAVTIHAGSYAAEMFAAHGGRQHVVGLIIVGGAQFEVPLSSLPRFLVLLAMQRVEDRHWGLNPYVDAKFGTCLNSYQMILGDEQGRGIDVTIESLRSVQERVRNFKKVYEIAERNEDVKGHVLDMVYYQALQYTSTAVIWNRLGLMTDGTRILYRILFRKLKPRTKLIGTDFLHAWWATVKCPHALWKNSIYHRDISPSNLMFKRMSDGKIMVEDGPTGTDVPARSHSWHWLSLKKGSKSFIWVLTWITLRHDNGVLRSRPLDDWLTIDRSTRVVKKTAFLHQHARRQLQAGIGHEGNLEVAREYMDMLGVTTGTIQFSKTPHPISQVDTTFQRLLSGTVDPFLSVEN
ncbi:hypothetical protein EDC04DRAFT_2611920 [Pisolithus marmoratus]|nr:hypothetical protein EDC04DRAFT_2611920 [Pisolithus marmoratus]